MVSASTTAQPSVVIVLRDAALDRLTLVEPGDALNATGRVEITASGPVVVVTDGGGLVQAGDPVATAAPTGPLPADGGIELAGLVGGAPQPSTPAQTTSASETGKAGPFPVGTGALAVLLLVAIAGASLAGAALRRAQARRRSAARVAARLTTFAARSAVASGGPRPRRIPAERGPCTNHSA